jgi:DHA1 family inner membrane transport protein
VGVGAIGGGGFFAVYSYITPILTERTGLPLGAVPVVLGILGLGMVAGNVVAGQLMDWRPLASMFGVFLAMGSFFALFAVTSTHPVLAVANVFLLGLGVALPTGLQVHLMDVSADAQTLAAPLNHASFNLANALGAALGGAVLAAGLGLTAPMWVAVVLTVAGTALLGVSAGLDRRSERTRARARTAPAVAG